MARPDGVSPRPAFVPEAREGGVVKRHSLTAEAGTSYRPNLIGVATLRAVASD
jgi:hypothetical protein